MQFAADDIQINPSEQRMGVNYPMTGLKTVTPVLLLQHPFLYVLRNINNGVTVI